MSKLRIKSIEALLAVEEGKRLPRQLTAFDLVLFDSRVETPHAAAAFGLRPNVMLWYLPR